MPAESKPDAASELLQEYRDFLRSSGWRAIATGAGLLAGAVLIAVLMRGAYPFFTALLPLLGLLSVITGLLDLRRSRRADAAGAAAFGEMADFDTRVHEARLRHTPIIIGGLILLFLVQYKAGLAESVGLAGLVKERVFEGQWWRLLSCALLHGNLLHVLLNGASLLALGRLVETQGDPDDLPIVFTVAVFTGSVASCVLMPSVPSVGASGGILGLSGYLLVLAFRRRRQLPAGLSRMLWRGVALTALVGLLGYHYVDNAAHAGGLLGGALTGFVLVRREPVTRDPNSAGATAKAMIAWGCLGWFGGAAFFCVRHLLGF